VVVAVVRFDGHPGGDVTLGTRWQILGRDGDELAFERSTVIQAAMGPSVEDLVVWSEFREPFVTDPFRDCHVSVSRRE